MKPYYEDSAVTIYHGDCRLILPQLPKVDLVLTDPPYGVELKGKRAKQRDGGVIARNTPETYEDTPQYIADVVIPIITQCVVSFPAVVVTPGTRNMWKYPEPNDIGCFFSAASTGMGAWGFTCMSTILYYGKDPYLAKGLGSRPNSCGQTYPNDANKYEHPCAKPIRMIHWLVSRCSLEGQLILDPFMGSGTTLRAAKDLGRKAIGIEICEAYCEIAAKRMSQTVFALATEAECLNSDSTAQQGELV